MVKKFSLSKSERLSSGKAITSLFQTGKFIYAPPLRIIYKLAGEAPHPVLMAVSVPKRLFKKAVDRNLLKRRIREAYRMHKPALYSMVSGEKGRKLHLVIQYQQPYISDYHTIEKALFKGLDKLQVQLKEGRSFSADNGSPPQSD